MGQKSKHWADQTAENIARARGDLELYTCASGITPSGTVHIGNFREIISVDLVARALRDMGKNVRFIYSWDDYDVFRKVPANMPEPETLEKYLRFPITMVPDTSGAAENYARRNEIEVEKVLPEVGIHPEYLYQAERYRAHLYADGIKKALEKRDLIRDCLNRWRDDEHKIADGEEYWPISAFCRGCNKDTTEITGWDGEWTVSYRCSECGSSYSVDLREAEEIKLGWRVDWPMRWAYERTVFEPAGKDHHSRGGSFDTARLVSQEVYGWPAPESFRYDFIGVKGTPGKMSSSKGAVISLADVLRVYQPEVVRYMFAGTRPNTEFSVGFDLDVLKIYEDYDKTERIAWGAEQAKNEEIFAKERRIYELSQVDGMPAEMPYQAPFRHVCNLLQINGGDVSAVIASAPPLTAEQEARLRARCERAWYWINECAPDEFRFTLRADGSRADLDEASSRSLAAVRDEIAPVADECDEKEISRRLYDIAEKCGVEPKKLFGALYNALINKEQGPRLASFIKIIGGARLERILSVY